MSVQTRSRWLKVEKSRNLTQYALKPPILCTVVESLFDFYIAATQQLLRCCGGYEEKLRKEMGLGGGLSMRICYALDRDETVETSNGPVPLSLIRRLGAGRRRSGFAS